MGISFPNDGTRKYLTADIGAVSSVTGWSIVGLINPDSASRGAVMSLLNGGSYVAQIIIDGGSWFGKNDFTGMGGSLAPQAGDWQVIAADHTAGSGVLRWHYYNRTDGGSVLHADGTWTIGNPGAVDEIRIGDGDNESKGDAAAIMWFAAPLGDAAFAAFATSDSLADWLAAGPEALWADDFAADLTGNGHDILSTTGTVDVGTDPPGFDYSLTAPSNDGELAAVLPALAAALTGDQLDDAVLAGVFPALTASLTGDIQNDGVLAGLLPQLTAAVTADAINDSALAGLLPALTASLTLDVRNDGVLAGTFPLLAAQFFDEQAAGMGPRDIARTPLGRHIQTTRVGRSVR